MPAKAGIFVCGVCQTCLSKKLGTKNKANSVSGIDKA
jgi:hypothetical protein